MQPPICKRGPAACCSSTTKAESRSGLAGAIPGRTSRSSASNRTLRRVDADAQFKAHTPVYVNVADLGFKTVNRIIIAIGLLLGLVYLAVMPRHGARTGESDGIEFALFILLMLMF